MRRYINIIAHLLTEAPITSTELMGDPHADTYPQRNASFDTGTGFSKADRRLLKSPKGIEKVIRAFSKTQHHFEIFFANTDAVDGDDDGDNDRVDDWAKSLQAGVHDEFGIIKGRTDVIRMVLLSNLSPINAGRMPVSGWTLAHKIGHALQDEVYRTGWTGDLADRIREINMELNRIGDLSAGIEPVPSSGLFLYSYTTSDILTMKSARYNKINTEFELFAELIAQYLVVGRIKLNVNHQLQPLSDALNEKIREMFDSLKGKVLVEV